MIGMMNHMETTLETFPLVENPFDVLGQVNILTFDYCDKYVGILSEWFTYKSIN